MTTIKGTLGRQPKYFLPGTVYDAALNRIRWIFDEFEHVAVSNSGGKDSTVVTYLALQVAAEKDRLPLRVHWLDQECEFEATVNYQRKLLHLPGVDPRWYQIPFKLFNATSHDETWLNVWGEGEEWVRPKEPDSVHVNDFGVDRFVDLLVAIGDRESPNGAVLTGVRSEESPSRRLGLTSYPAYKWVTWAGKQSGHTVFHPIYDWSFTDIWHAIATNDWPYNCNPGDAPIWMGDFSHRPLKEVQPGDAVIGWERVAPHFTRYSEQGGGRRQLTIATVLRKFKKVAPVVRVTMESGRTIRCTPDHLWLHDQGNCENNREGEHGTHRRFGKDWFGPPRVGCLLGHVIEPWEYTEPTAGTGWLGGIYDGEGHGPVIPQNLGPVFDRIGYELEAAGFPAIKEQARANHWRWRMTGGRQTFARFLDQVRPVRATSLTSRILTGRMTTPDRIVSIEPDGEEEVFALETTTGNYVAWGYASKNSMYDLMYQYGVKPRNMRVSNYHHETAIHALFFLQEIEPATWEAATRRLRGINTAGQIGKSDFFVHDLPFMFTSWTEYRDYLLDNLITNEEDRETFRHQFKGLDRRLWYVDESARSKAEVQSLIANDKYYTKLNQFYVTHHLRKEELERRGLVRPT